MATEWLSGSAAIGKKRQSAKTTAAGEAGISQVNNVSVCSSYAVQARGDIKAAGLLNLGTLRYQFFNKSISSATTVLRRR